MERDAGYFCMNDINFTMYKLAGIIAEYDPFHNGHAWQLQTGLMLPH